jgi:AcrR family transcriptional regulator
MSNETASVGRNKHGQALGRKGVESRRRLLEAGRTLLTRAEKLTPSSVARAAGLASQTFYLYFADINELLLILAEEATGDMGEVMATLDGPWDPASIEQHSRRFVDAFYGFWDTHSAVLSFRNFQSDLGDPAFIQVRQEAAMPIVTSIAKRISTAQGAEELSEPDALARAVIIYAAIERLAARPATLARRSASLQEADLRRAEAEILTLLFTRPSTRG